jgi:hypothetical protein
LSLPAAHDLQRLRRRLVVLTEAEAYLDVLKDELMADDLEVQLTDRPKRPANYTVVDEVRVDVPYDPTRDLELMLDVFDYALERSSKCPSP